MVRFFRIFSQVIAFSVGFVILVGIILFASFFTAWNNMYEGPEYSEAVIEIRSDNDFQNYDFIYGNGTPEEPYVIERMQLVSYADMGIWIRNVDSSFVIKDCLIEDGYDYGISIYDTTGKIIIRNNIITNSYTGIQIFNKVENTLEENYSIEISGNYIEAWDNALNFIGANNAVVQNNSFVGSRYYYTEAPVFIKTGDNVAILDNEFIQTSLSGVGLESLGAATVVEFANNFINNNPITLIINSQNLILSNLTFGQLILINCQNATICEYSNSEVPGIIELIQCENCSVENFVNPQSSEIEVLGFAPHNLMLYNSSNIFVCKNKFGSTQVGVYIVNCFNITILENKYFGNYYGIVLSGSRKISLVRNDISNCSIGISIKRSNSVYCSNNSIIYCYYGARIEYSDSVLTNNSLYKNVLGIQVYGGSNEGLIANCTFFFNQRYAIYLYGEVFSVIHCIFDHNAINSYSQTIDSGNGNSWIYNKWSDYEGSGYYYIAGNAKSFDPYPSTL